MRALLLIAVLAVPCAALPRSPKDLKETIGFGAMEGLLKELDRSPFIEVSTAGQSGEGRPLYVVHIDRSAGKAPWKVLFYAQQHGDEVSGKDAMLFLARDIARDPTLLPVEVDLWLLPSLNPDGGLKDTRRNAAGADLNRDHMQLEQPETQALYRLVQRLRPHVAVDCHEFTRDSEDYAKKGWVDWPVITMDSLNNPLFDPAVRAAAWRWVEEAAAPMGKAGHAYRRYIVGGVPPDEELRYSAPDVDGGLNGVGMYGGLSFIVEAGALRSSKGSENLGQRAAAFYDLFRHLLRYAVAHPADLKIAQRTLPDFIPVNYFWASPGAVSSVPMTDKASGRTLGIRTANLMTELVVKRSVSRPTAYIVDPRFEKLLKAHAVPFTHLESERTSRAERCKLLRLEDAFDEVYNRYEGRQIVRCDAAAAIEAPAKSLWVPLEGEAAHRAVLLLEPNMLYGLYQYPGFKSLVSGDGTLPVSRATR
ncbi:MAG: M14 family zinc carboxypeptidase [Elusimicrobiota bacterium]